MDINEYDDCVIVSYTNDKRVVTEDDKTRQKNIRWNNYSCIVGGEKCFIST